MSGQRVVFFGAGGYAEEHFEALNQQYAPVAFGDNDPKKHGTSLMGFPILSLDEIEVKYPRCQYFITVNVLAKPYVIESLLARGVDRSRIVNFEDYKRYVSCWQLEMFMWYSYVNNSESLFFCCSDFGKNSSPQVPLNHDALAETIEKFAAMREEIIGQLNSPAKATADNPCLGCRNVKEGLWRASRRVHILNIMHRSICNFKCSYCNASNALDSSSPLDVEKMLAFLRFVKDKKIIDGDTEIHLTSGEISIHPLRDKIMAEVKDNPCTIYTNASAYSEKIGELLSGGRSRLYPSIDAGTRETFAMIKGVDMFDRVCENLRRYSLDGSVQLKYIMLPGLNDNEADIEGFIDLCSRLKVKAVDVTRDTNKIAQFDEHTIKMIARMLNALHDRGIKAYAQDNAFGATPNDQRRIEEEIAELGRVRRGCE